MRRPHRPFRRPARLGLLSLCLAGCAAPPPPDLLLITLDTTRADHLSFLGDAGPPTPRIDGIAAGGAAFAAAFAPAPLTLPSHATMMTGLLPTEHGVRDNGGFALGEASPTLAALLADRGWRTGAFVGAAVLDHATGLDRGFSVYDDAVGESGADGPFQYGRRRGDAVVAAALDWLDGAGPEPVFLWVHLFDAHAPYAAPEPERGRFADPYDAEVAFLDRVVGDLLDGWAARRDPERTVVAVAADHGESLGEHGEATHGILVYDATLRVPLAVRAPGAPPGLRVEAPVSLRDLAPTLLDLLGVPAPEGMSGRSLAPLVRGGATAEPEPIYFECLAGELHHGWAPLRGVRDGRWKLIEGAATELYDVAADPAEIRDLAARRPAEVAGLQRILDERFPDAPHAPGRALDAATRARLEALGYLGGEATPAGGPPPDPRDRIALLARMDAADARFAAGDADGAVALYRAVLAEDPADLEAVVRLADLLHYAGRYAEAAEAFARAEALDPTDPSHPTNRALALEALGRDAEAAEALARARRLDPGYRPAREKAWARLAAEGRLDVVAREAREALAADPADGAALAALVHAEHAGEGPAAVARAAEKALERLPGDPDLLQLRGDAEAMAGRLDRAEAAWRAVLARRPGDPRASLQLGRLLLARGDVAEARGLLETGARADRGSAELQVALAEARARAGDPTGAWTALRAARRLAPELPALWATWCAVALADGRPAREPCERAVALAPDDPVARANLARAAAR